MAHQPVAARLKRSGCRRPATLRTAVAARWPSTPGAGRSVFPGRRLPRRGWLDRRPSPRPGVRHQNLRLQRRVLWLTIVSLIVAVIAAAAAVVALRMSGNKAPATPRRPRRHPAVCDPSHPQQAARATEASAPATRLPEAPGGPIPLQPDDAGTIGCRVPDTPGMLADEDLSR
jgi:hypothetical protein